MKKITLLSLLSFTIYFASAQPSWTWLQGDAYTSGYGIYGTKGVASPLNKPSYRSGSVSWRDQSGNTWLFGGSGLSATGYGYLNDMWKYTPSTGLWTWVNGDREENQFGVYGTKGVASPGNKIRARGFATSWTDASGDFYIFGGQGYDPTLQAFVYIYFNDLWKYSPSTGLWTWLAGDTAYRTSSVYPGVFGTKGVAAASNKPATRINTTSWADNSGNLWLFGGTGLNNAGFGLMNDLWKYALSTGLWTWMGGDTLTYQNGNYGQKGVESAVNRPGARYNATSWTDAANNLWLFGGGTNLNKTYPYTGFAYLNDLWKFSPVTNNWTWVSGDMSLDQKGVYGVMNVSSPDNKPGARNFASPGMDLSGNLLLYGGSGSATSYNDLWKYSPASNQWTWLKGDSTTTAHRTIWGQKNVPSDSTQPQGSSTLTWTDSPDNFWLSYFDRTWKYTFSTNQWTWITGDSSSATSPALNPVYGIKGITAATNTPGTRQYSNTWTDASGDLWLFGGYVSFTRGNTSVSGQYNDLWKYTVANNQWTWISGDSIPYPFSSFGTKGVPDPGNKPRARQQAVSWTDPAGNFWLYGGKNTNYGGYFNDLWRYTPATGIWTWMKGDSLPVSPYQSGVYGTVGVAAINNNPPGRYAATTWTDGLGNLWLFGGRCDLQGAYNDVWKYSVASGLWTWMAGQPISFNFPSQSPGYGTKGAPGTGNTPGSRSGSVGWTDPQGNLWLFGGTPYYNSDPVYALKAYDDLWKFTPSTNLWTWMSGNNPFVSPAPKGKYGIKGVPAADNKPPAKNAAASWTDAAGNLFMFGGYADSIANTTPITRYYNDVWQYTPSSGLWTWLSGDSTTNPPGTYGTQGVASPNNTPGGRTTVAWQNGSGTLWIYGGNGYAGSGFRTLNDMMKFTISSALPVLFSSFTAQKQQQSVQLSWSTAQEQNSMSFIIERSADGIFYSSIGTVAASGNTTSASRYSFTDVTPLQGNNYYRLKEIDKDYKFMYSGVQKVFIGEEAAHFTILSNPVQHDLQINIQLPSAQKLELQVRDAGGHLLISKTYTAGMGSTLLQLAAERLAKGTYFINIQSESLHSTKAFIKQ